uniref:hypothetical protein n=1 Tax=Amycolatopsis sp. CA-096443 TaxID=3239919 RepID=UPI003F4959DE
MHQPKFTTQVGLDTATGLAWSVPRTARPKASAKQQASLSLIALLPDEHDPPESEDEADEPEVSDLSRPLPSRKAGHTPLSIADEWSQKSIVSAPKRKVESPGPNRLPRFAAQLVAPYCRTGAELVAEGIGTTKPAATTAAAELLCRRTEEDSEKTWSSEPERCIAGQLRSRAAGMRRLASPENDRTLAELPSAAALLREASSGQRESTSKTAPDRRAGKEHDCPRKEGAHSCRSRDEVIADLLCNDLQVPSSCLMRYL